MSGIRIYRNGKEIASGISELKLTPSLEQQEQKFDQDFEITGIITNVLGISDSLGKMFDSCFFTRKEIKQMFYDITHGYDIVFTAIVELKGDRTEHEHPIIIRNPSHLRKFLRGMGYVRIKHTLKLKDKTK